MWKVRKITKWFYGFADFTATFISWYVFNLIRNYWNAADLHKGLFLQSAFVAAAWVLIFYILGTYNDLYQKSRLRELLNTVVSSFFGAFLLFFLFIIHAKFGSNSYYEKSFFLLFALQALTVGASRMLILQFVKKQLRLGQVQLNTLIIGGSNNAIKLFQELQSHSAHLGYRVLGFVYPTAFSTNGLSSFLPNFGPVEKLNHIIEENAIEQVILAVEKAEHQALENIINRLAENNVQIKVIPDAYDIITGSVKTDSVYGALLIEIKPDLIPEWQQNIKRLIDMSLSIVGLALFTPLMLYLALRVRLSSPGPIIYRQERIGFKGKPFTILKFRSMVADAETDRPMLSSENDPRITAFGKIMRQWRLDELPQLWNILKGDMSLVGPRPERKYYIDKILKHNTYYNHLLRAKPGLTSWGMVKFGYAENIDEMIERMQYDLIYVKNLSISLDFKIIVHTIVTILRREGR